ncbi:hypothetical protein OV203_47245 [Nannocystis sp. ILAH1]|nr:hypothetical protein [Nannocystis sp. ILAH1]MCY0994814.1 hypothetical protein [Nannocystis sp. ILAH1]
MIDAAKRAAIHDENVDATPRPDTSQVARKERRRHDAEEKAQLEHHGGL